MSENGILSFRGPFISTIIRDFDSFFHFQPLIAPLWTDLDSTNSSQLEGGRILFRMASDENTLKRAKNLTREHFPSVNFEPTDVIISTWVEVRHRRTSNMTSDVSLQWCS